MLFKAKNSGFSVITSHDRLLGLLVSDWLVTVMPAVRWSLSDWSHKQTDC